MTLNHLEYRVEGILNREEEPSVDNRHFPAAGTGFEELIPEFSSLKRRF
jgi:hypothetical protein